MTKTEQDIKELTDIVVDMIKQQKNMEELLMTLGTDIMKANEAWTSFMHKRRTQMFKELVS